MRRRQINTRTRNTTAKPKANLLAVAVSHTPQSPGPLPAR